MLAASISMAHRWSVSPITIVVNCHYPKRLRLEAWPFSLVYPLKPPPKIWRFADNDGLIAFHGLQAHSIQPKRPSNLIFIESWEALDLLLGLSLLSPFLPSRPCTSISIKTRSIAKADRSQQNSHTSAIPIPSAGSAKNISLKDLVSLHAVYDRFVAHHVVFSYECIFCLIR